MIYFDNAATGMPKSAAVIRAVSEAMKNCGNPGRGGHEFSIAAAEKVYAARRKLASMFGTRPELVIFTSGATEALNIAIKGTNRRGGVTVVSSLEHNAVMRPVNALRRSGETVMRQFRVDTGDDPVTLENFRIAARGATNIVVTHASNVCGRLLPVRALRDNAPSDAVFILDASQTAGHIPVDVAETGADIVCIPAHKGLFGPMGVGALIINPESDVYVETLLEGGTGTNSRSFEMPENYPERLEPGTQNVGGIAGLAAALDGFTYPENEMSVFAFLLDSLRGTDGIRLYGAPADEKALSRYMPVLLFNKRGFDCESLCAVLASEGFALRAGYHCAPAAHRTVGSYETGGARLSLGRHNTRREAELFLKALAGIRP